MPRNLFVTLPDLKERAQYFMDVDALTAQDHEVHRLLVEVLNL